MVYANIIIMCAMTIGALTYYFYSKNHEPEAPHQETSYAYHNPEPRQLRQIGDSEIICSICMNELSSMVGCVLECNHMFHHKCIDDWFKIQRTCPTCRRFIQ